MNVRNKRFLFAGVAIVVALVGIIIYSVIQSHSSPAYIKKTVDKDTGEILYTEPNKTPEKDNTNSVIVLGSEQLINAGMTQDQFQLTKQLLNTYSQKQLQNKYSLLKILPEGFKSSQNTITAGLKLGDSSTVLSLTISYHDLVYVRVRIKDPKNNAAYTYDSGELSTTTSLNKGPQLPLQKD